MKIGIDIQSTVGPYSGLGVYTRRVLDTLAPAHDFKRPFVRGSEEYHFFCTRPLRNTLDRLWWENQILPRQIRRAGIDLLHVPAFSPPLVRSRKIKVVTTVHDLIGLIFPNQIGLASRLYWGRWLPQAVKNSDFLVADSQSTRADLMRHLGVPAGKIRVIALSGHEGFSNTLPAGKIAQVKAALGIRGRYFLFVGTLEPRKNLGRVLAAFAEFQKTGAEAAAYQLVVVGSKDFAHGQFFRSLMRDYPAAAAHVLFTGYLEHETLNSLYQGSTAFLYPSLYEGFGIPILEAMGSGAPVITSSTSSMPEIAGAAALLVDPLKTAEIRDAMLRIAEDENFRQTLIAKGLERIRLFSWEKTVRELQSVYQSLA